MANMCMYMFIEHGKFPSEIYSLPKNEIRVMQAFFSIYMDKIDRGKS